MSDVSYLILLLGSKCAEIQKTCSDINLLGTEYRDRGAETSLEHLRVAFNEAVAVAELLADRSIDLCHDYHIISDYSKLTLEKLSQLRCNE